MTQLALTSVQEAALNAAGEALIDLGFNCNIGYTVDFIGERPYFTIAAHVPNAEVPQVVCRGDSSLARAMRLFIDAANEIIANPPVKTLDQPADVKKAALDLVDEYRNGEHGRVFAPLLNELADRVSALPVKP